MNFQNHDWLLNEYRQCQGIGTPPPTIPPQPTPTIQDMCKCIGKWTYFWTQENGDKWVFVILTGLSESPQTQTFTPAVWGCTKEGYFAVLLKDIINYTHI